MATQFEVIGYRLCGLRGVSVPAPTHVSCIVWLNVLCDISALPFPYHFLIYLHIVCKWLIRFWNANQKITMPLPDKLFFWSVFNLQVFSGFESFVGALTSYHILQVSSWGAGALDPIQGLFQAFRKAYMRCGFVSSASLPAWLCWSSIGVGCSGRWRNPLYVEGFRKCVDVSIGDMA